MTLCFYMDVHVPFAITAELRLRGVDVLTAQDDQAAKFGDSKLLDRALTLGRVLVTQDIGFLREAARRQEQSIRFAGVIFVSQIEVTIGRAVMDLELCAKACNPEEWMSRVEFLPL